MKKKAQIKIKKGAILYWSLGMLLCPILAVTAVVSVCFGIINKMVQVPMAAWKKFRRRCVKMDARHRKGMTRQIKSMNKTCMSPTINEILYQRIDRELSNATSTVEMRMCKFFVGDIVQFRFNNIFRTGRVTTVIHRCGTSLYHIESDAGTWYRGIDQSEIIRQIKDAR